MFGRKKNSGFSIMEYVVILMILVGAMFVFKDYIIRGLLGRWKTTSDQWGYGRQYDPNTTIECLYDSQFNMGWYDVACFENKGCSYGNKSCERAAIAACNATAYCK